MKKLSPSVISTTRSGNWQYAVVESTSLGLVAVRLGSAGTGSRLTNLNVVGTVGAGDLVVVDYSTNVPYVRAVQYWSDEQIDLSPVAIPLEIPRRQQEKDGILDPCSMGGGDALGTKAWMGGGVGFGVPAYVSSSCGLSEADANTLSTAKVIAMGLGDSLYLMDGFIRNGSWSFTAGVYVFLAVGGGVTQTRPTLSGQCITVLGIALTGDILRFQPELVVVELL